MERRLWPLQADSHSLAKGEKEPGRAGGVANTSAPSCPTPASSLTQPLTDPPGASMMSPRSMDSPPRSISSLTLVLEKSRAVILIEAPP